jgi:hypothetical protein
VESFLGNEVYKVLCWHLDVWILCLELRCVESSIGAEVCGLWSPLLDVWSSLLDVWSPLLEASCVKSSVRYKERGCEARMSLG